MYEKIPVTAVFSLFVTNISFLLHVSSSDLAACGIFSIPEEGSGVFHSVLVKNGYFVSFSSTQAPPTLPLAAYSPSRRRAPGIPNYSRFVESLFVIKRFNLLWRLIVIG